MRATRATIALQGRLLRQGEEAHSPSPQHSMPPSRLRRMGPKRSKLDEGPWIEVAAGLLPRIPCVHHCARHKQKMVSNMNPELKKEISGWTSWFMTTKEIGTNSLAPLWRRRFEPFESNRPMFCSLAASLLSLDRQCLCLLKSAWQTLSVRTKFRACGALLLTLGLTSGLV